MEVAGSVVIQIGGDLSSFESALAKAQTLAASFDAKVSAQLSGAGLTSGLAKIAAGVDQTNSLLQKLVGSGTAAGAALAKIDTATQPVAVALQKVTAASITANAELSKLGSGGNGAALAAGTISAKEFAAALEATGGNLSRITPQMLGLAQAEQVVTQAAQAATTSFRGFTQAEIDAFRSQQAGANFSRDLNERFGLLNATTKSARDSATAFRDLGLVEAAASTATKGHTAALMEHGAAAGLDSTRWMALTHAARGFSEQVALGISPIRALTSEMAHLSYVASGPGGVGGAFKAVGSTIAGAATSFGGFVTGGSAAGTALAAVLAAAAAAAAGLYAVKRAAEDSEQRTVTWGETIAATFDVIRDHVREILPTIQSAASTVFSPIIYALEQLGSAAVDIAELVVNSFHAAFADIEAIWSALPDVFGLAFTKAANKGISALNLLVKKSSDAVDEISKALNNIPGVNIPLLMAGKDTIQPLDESGYLENLKKAVADRNDAINQIMTSHPIRDVASSIAGSIGNLGQEIVDRIKNNNALTAIDSIGKVDFSQSISGANAFGSALGGVGKAASGIQVEFGGTVQQVINVTRAFEDAKRSQLAGLEATRAQLHGWQNDLKTVQNYLNAVNQTPVKDVFGDIFNGSGGQAAIQNAVSSVDKVFQAFDEGRMSIKDVDQAIEIVRQSLIQMGGATTSVDTWISKLVNAEINVRQLKSNVDGLSQSIRNIPNRTITITVKTQQIGSGTQSLYDVGGGSTVGVTRYGGDGSTSGPSLSANTVPNYDGGGTSTVNVTRFSSTGPWQNPNGATAAEWAQLTPQNKQDIYDGKTDYAHILYPDYYRAGGGPISANTPYWVGEQGPELVVPSGAGTVIPNAQSLSLAHSLGGAGGTSSQVGAEQDSFYTLLQSIETNTKKTAQLLDEIHTAAASSYSGLGGGGSSSGGSSYNQSAWDAAFSRAFDIAGANYQAARMAGGGDGIVPFAQGLVASPFDIAVNAARLATGQGGTPSVGLGAGGATSYERSLAAQNQQMAAISAMNIKAGGLGFATGGMIDAGDTQKVEFFKNPNERVIIAKPDQFQDMRSQSTEKSSNDNRPINVYLTQNHTWNGNAPPSNESTSELRRMTSLAIRDGLRSLNGR